MTRHDTYPTPRAATEAMALTLGYSVHANRGGWIRIWDAAGSYQGKVQGWPSAYARLATAYAKTGNPPPTVSPPHRPRRPTREDGDQ